MSVPDPSLFDALRTARDTLDARERDLRAAEYHVLHAERALDAARRRADAAAQDAAAADLHAAQTARDDAHTAERDAQTDVDTAYAALLGSFDPDDPVTALSGDRPVVLFPVRLETRFVTDGSVRELRVRIFPEELHVDAHETELTDDEVHWGEAFLDRTSAAQTDDEAALAWTELADRFGAPRAAWIVRTLEADDAPPRRAASWSRAPRTDLMPDRWEIVGLRRGDVQFRATGTPIPHRLKVGWNPQADAPDTDADAVLADAEMRWMVDFDEAERVGMAVRIDLTDYAFNDIEQLVAFGVKVSAGDAADLIEDQIDALHYTTGVGFVAANTPTNNTETAPSGYTSRDPMHAASFRRERLHTPLTDDTDGARLAEALGISRETLAPLWGAHARVEAGSRAMNTALWPATWGYYLDRIFNHETFIVDTDLHPRWIRQGDRKAAYELFRDHVRARGPFSTLRVGRQPYGVLPVTDLDQWSPLGDEEAYDDRIRSLLHRLRDGWWNVRSRSIHRVGLGLRPESTLISLLTQTPVPETFGVRQFFSRPVFKILLELYQVWTTTDDYHEETRKRIDDDLRALGLPENKIDSVPELPFAAQSISANGMHLLPLPVVRDGALSANAPLEDNYVAAIRERALLALRDAPPSADRMTLLYLVLRHAKLSAYARAIQVATDEDGEYETYHDDDRYDLSSFTSDRTWDAFEQVHPDSGMTYVAHYEHASANGTHEDADLVDFDAALDVLAACSESDLDAFFRETMSLCHSRLDAWETAFATKRLATLRTTGPGNGEPTTGTYVGGYGWLWDLSVPAIDDAARVGDGTEASFDPTPDTVGYVHAPSIDQATTAALLRSGHQARAGEGSDNPFDIDLSSERVRRAKTLLDGVRNGQSIGALLGYRFERRLQERGLGGVLPAFRDAYPPVAGKERDEADAPGFVAASTTVDGLQIVRAFRAFEDGGPDWVPDAVETSVAADDADAIRAVGRETDADLDTVADALMTESVFQTVRGNHARAGAVLDAVAGGDAPPPELEAMRTPRRGRSVQHRVFVPLQDASGAPAPSMPRGQAAPRVNAFCATMLGDLHRYVAQGVYRPGTPQAVSAVVRLDALGLDALDVVAMAATASGGASELEQRLRDYLLHHRPDGVAPDAPVDLAVAPSSQPDDTIDLATGLELARSLHDLVTNARPLSGDDLSAVGADETDAGVVDVSELRDRAQAAVAALDDVTTRVAIALDLHAANQTDALQPGETFAARFRTVLYDAAAFGIPSSIPVAVDGAPDATERLRDQAAVVHAALVARRNRVDALDEAFDAASASARQHVDAHTERLRVVFGASHPVVPRFTPANATEVAASLNAGPAFLDGDVGAPESVFSAAARVRPGVARLQRVRDYADALDRTTAPGLAVGQVPFTGTDDRWAGVSGGSVRNGTVSLLAAQTGDYDPRQPLAGLFVDAWDEVVPDAMQTTGLAFNFDAPDSEPPNAILLATPGDPTQPWSTDALLSTLRSVLDALPARVAVNNGGLGHFLPATYFAFNPNDDTVSTDFSAYLDV